MKIERSLTADIDVETLALVERVAAEQGMTSGQYVAQAVRRVVESDDDFRAFVQAGIDAADRGETVPHAVVMAELDAMIAKHRTRCG